MKNHLILSSLTTICLTICSANFGYTVQAQQARTGTTVRRRRHCRRHGKQHQVQVDA